MSKLRDTALAAVEADKAKREAAERERAAREASGALRAVDTTPLAEWFPDVDWEYVGRYDGFILVRERGGYDLVLGVRPEQNGAVGIFRADVFGSLASALTGGNPVRYRLAQLARSAGEIGEYIDRTEPKVQEVPVQ